MVATTTVGVRELKERATRLVRRAASGERVVITRYGKPYALLGPAATEQGGAEPAQGRRMTEWLEQRRAFERLLPRLERRHEGRWVALCGGRVVGSGGDPDMLFERVWKRLRGRTFYLGRVGGPPPVVDVPGFELA